jgi:hypothetical protein
LVLSDWSSGTFSTSASSERLRLLEVGVTPAEQTFWPSGLEFPFAL